MSNFTSTDPMKAGLYSTEFYVALFSAVIGLLITAGVIHPSNPDALAQQLATIAGAAITIISTMSYILGRSSVKAAALTPAPVVAQPTVNVAPSGAPQRADAETIPAPAQTMWTPDPGLTTMLPKISTTKAAAQDMPNISPI